MVATDIHHAGSRCLHSSRFLGRLLPVVATLWRPQAIASCTQCWSSPSLPISQISPLPTAPYRIEFAVLGSILHHSLRVIAPQWVQDANCECSVQVRHNAYDAATLNCLPSATRPSGTSTIQTAYCILFLLRQHLLWNLRKIQLSLLRFR